MIITEEIHFDDTFVITEELKREHYCKRPLRGRHLELQAKGPIKLDPQDRFLIEQTSTANIKNDNYAAYEYATIPKTWAMGTVISLLLYYRGFYDH